VSGMPHAAGSSAHLFCWYCFLWYTSSGCQTLEQPHRLVLQQRVYSLASPPAAPGFPPDRLVTGSYRLPACGLQVVWTQLGFPQSIWLGAGTLFLASWAAGSLQCVGLQAHYVSLSVVEQHESVRIMKV
jgi:hypothetical protein